MGQTWDAINATHTLSESRTKITGRDETNASNWSGASTPTTTFTGQLWVDTTGSPATLKMYNGSSWISLGTLQANLAHLPLTGGTLTGDLTLSGDPDANLKAATKQYVDNYVEASGSAPSNTNRRWLDTSLSLDSGNPQGEIYILRAYNSSTTVWEPVGHLLCCRMTNNTGGGLTPGAVTVLDVSAESSVKTPSALYQCQKVFVSLESPGSGSEGLFCFSGGPVPVNTSTTGAMGDYIGTSVSANTATVNSHKNDPGTFGVLTQVNGTTPDCMLYGSANKQGGWQFYAQYGISSQTSYQIPQTGTLPGASERMWKFVFSRFTTSGSTSNDAILLRLSAESTGYASRYRRIGGTGDTSVSYTNGIPVVRKDGSNNITVGGAEFTFHTNYPSLYAGSGTGAWYDGTNGYGSVSFGIHTGTGTLGYTTLVTESGTDTMSGYVSLYYMDFDDRG